MKIAMFGASGNIGNRILNEALSRGYKVTAMLRPGVKIETGSPLVQAIEGNIFNPEDVARLVAGHDIVISAFGPDPGEPSRLAGATRSLIEGMKKTTVKRLIVVGGAGSLLVAPDVLLLDTPEFPSAWKPVALAHKDALSIYLGEKELEWSYAHPAAFIEPGLRMGHYRLGGDRLFTDHKGESRISMEDFAVALLDEAENHRHIRKRFSVAY